MAADSPYQTFGEIRSAILADSKETTSSTFVALVDRWINEGHEQVTLRKKRDWLDEQFTVQVNADVSATCTVTNGSTTVTFASAQSFPSGVELQFNTSSYEEIYDVSSATSTTIVTLAKPFLGTTSTAATGVVFQPHVILDDSIRHVYQVYHQHSVQPLTYIGPQQMRQVQASGKVQRDFANYWTIFGQSNGARRLVIYPYPDEDYTLYIDANVFVPVLSASADEPVIPMQYRQILYWYGMYKVWLYHRNADQAAIALQNFNSFLARIDGEMRAEIDKPQLRVSYFKRSNRRFAKPFDPRIRD